MASKFFKHKQEASKEDKIRHMRATMKPQKLKIRKKKSDHHFDMKRVQCEAIDFDWMFEHENMENIIKILND